MKSTLFENEAFKVFEDVPTEAIFTVQENWVNYAKIDIHDLINSDKIIFDPTLEVKKHELNYWR